VRIALGGERFDGGVKKAHTPNRQFSQPVATSPSPTPSLQTNFLKSSWINRSDRLLAKQWRVLFQEVSDNSRNKFNQPLLLETVNSASHVCWRRRCSLVAAIRFPQPEVPKSPGVPRPGLFILIKEKARTEWPGFSHSLGPV